MKKLLGLALALLLVLGLAACGNVESVTKIIGDSQYYSKAEINAAMKVVVFEFKKDFGGCTLLELCYDENKTAAAQAEYAADHGKDEVIIILSSFETDENGGDEGCLNPNDTYENYQWVLARNRGGAWKLKDRGY